MRPLDNASVASAAKHLMRVDPALAPWIRRVGPLRLRPRASHFASLCGSIVGQQLSAKAASTIRARVFAGCANPKRPRPAEILRLSPTVLRAAGLSAQKAEYVRHVAEAFESGPLRCLSFARLSDEEIVERLVEIKGVGRWTAEMFLLFSLRRPDVFSAGDVALRSALQRIENRHLTPTECVAIAARWQPHRSTASLYLWQMLALPSDAQ